MVARDFARPGVIRQGWYLLCSAKKLRTGRVRHVEVGARRLVLYRDLAGRAHVVDGRCPHLGSDLALAHVTERGLLCEFHGWCWRALAVLWSTALDDWKMIEQIAWTGAFAPSDAALARYAGFVEGLPTW